MLQPSEVTLYFLRFFAVCLIMTSEFGLFLICSSVLTFMTVVFIGKVSIYSPDKIHGQNLQNRRRIVKFKAISENVKLHKRELQRSEHIEDAVKHFTLSHVRTPSRTTVHRDVDPRFAFVIRNVLSPEECNVLIAAAEETGFEVKRYNGNGEDSSRCYIESNHLSNSIIFERIRNCLPFRSYFDSESSMTLEELNHFCSGGNRVIECYGSLFCLNTSCRIKRYGPSQHLKVHRDVCVKVNGRKDVYSIYTIVLYLNEGYTGGFTRFCDKVDPQPINEKDPYSFIDFKGHIGDALVFRHEILHKGGVVRDGVKYILTLDVGYRVDQSERSDFFK